MFLLPLFDRSDDIDELTEETCENVLLLVCVPNLDSLSVKDLVLDRDAEVVGVSLLVTDRVRVP